MFVKFKLWMPSYESCWLDPGDYCWRVPALVCCGLLAWIYVPVEPLHLLAEAFEMDALTNSTKYSHHFDIYGY